LDPACYALDGAILAAGAAVEWLMQAGLLDGYAGLEGFAGPSALERGLAFVPALAGLGAPHWDRAARGCWLGLDLATTQADLQRAVLEGIALRAAELVAALEARLGAAQRIAIDGGLSRSTFFTGFLAAAIGRPIEIAGTADVTALGVLHLCLAAIGAAERPRLAGGRHIVPEAPLPDALRARFGTAVALSREWARSRPGG
jgi:glycerol kinase